MEALFGSETDNFFKKRIRRLYGDEALPTPSTTTTSETAPLQPTTSSPPTTTEEDPEDDKKEKQDEKQRRFKVDRCTCVSITVLMVINTFVLMGVTIFILVAYYGFDHTAKTIDKNLSPEHLNMVAQKIATDPDTQYLLVSLVPYEMLEGRMTDAVHQMFSEWKDRVKKPKKHKPTIAPTPTPTMSPGIKQLADKPLQHRATTEEEEEDRMTKMIRQSCVDLSRCIFGLDSPKGVNSSEICRAVAKRFHRSQCIRGGGEELE